MQLRYWCIQDLQKPVNDFHVLYQNKQLYFPKLLGIPLCEADMGSLHHQLHSSAPQSRGFSQSQQDFHHWEECVKSQLLCSSSPTTSWERSCLHFLPPFGIFLLCSSQSDLILSHVEMQSIEDGFMVDVPSVSHILLIFSSFEM